MPEISASLRQPFAEQIAAFELRRTNLIPTKAWDDLKGAQHDRAFVVAGAMKADLLDDLARAVTRSIADGQSLEAFRKDFYNIVEDRGWHGWTGEGTKAGEAWRTRVIYRTNAKTSYAAGRLAQLRAAGYPFLIYRHGDSLNPRPEHLAWDGLVLPADHPFWEKHMPVNGWGCSCYVLGARSMEMARRLGGDPSKTLPEDWNLIDPKTGTPKGIDKGWDYAPGASVTNEINTIVQAKVSVMPEGPIRDSFAKEMAIFLAGSRKAETDADDEAEDSGDDEDIA
ncbi:phage head morphogenesis protein [Marivivens aquimaris]|uniref:phage head morphogenesis protein n=1 Tax=Marivivens aquimaris TaxID=2774876 RepID=UPI00187EC05A|nr:phage minor head protein [Marivivens aquimaris]